MTYRIPPLNALRAFEAAARHLSFKQAAAELNVTPGAVSQQVKILEDVLGVALFDRVHNGVMLTAEGQRFLTPIRTAFAGITAATEMVSPHAKGTDLTVVADPDFAIKWLVPKLKDFPRAHPDIRVRIGEAQSPDVLVEGIADIAILRGVSSYNGLRCDPVFSEQQFAVCAPGYLDGANGLFGKAMILRAGDDALWEAYLSVADARRLSDLDCVDFTSRELAIQGAIAGRGLALGSSLEDAADLAEGRLQRVSEHAVTCGEPFYVIYPPGRADCPAERAFINWIAQAQDQAA